MSEGSEDQRMPQTTSVAQQIAKFAFNLSAGILLPNAKRKREERMEDGIDNEAMDQGSDSVDEIDPYDSPEQSYSQDIIDEIEQYDKHDVEPSPAISLPGSTSREITHRDNDDDSDNSVFEEEISNREEAQNRPENVAENMPQTRHTIQITLRRHQSTGFGFRPACSVGAEPIVASVIKGSSAARHGLRIGDRIRSVCLPTDPPTYHTITSVQQIKSILGQCQSFVTLCVFRDMEQIDTEVDLEPLTPLGLGLQTTNIGIFVTSVQPGSIGDIFGYRFGDQILSINGHPVHDSDDIRRIRRRSLREVEQKNRHKKRSGIFRSVSSLSSHSRSDALQDARPNRERIRVSIGRRNMETLSEHPIAAIWSENEHRSSPSNILEPTFDEIQPSAPDQTLIDGVPTAPSSGHNQTLIDPTLPSLHEEEELINELRTLGTASSSDPSVENPLPSIVGTSDEPYLFKPNPVQPKPTQPGEATSTGPDNVVNENLKCVVCLDGSKEIVFQPCWHQVTCPECAVRLKECPLCREVIAIRRRPYRC